MKLYLGWRSRRCSEYLRAGWGRARGSGAHVAGECATAHGTRHVRTAPPLNPALQSSGNSRVDQTATIELATAKPVGDCSRWPTQRLDRHGYIDMGIDSNVLAHPVPSDCCFLAPSAPLQRRRYPQHLYHPGRVVLCLWRCYKPLRISLVGEDVDELNFFLFSMFLVWDFFRVATQYENVRIT